MIVSMMRVSVVLPDFRPIAMIRICAVSSTGGKTWRLYS
jgi:hypothetical protein